MGGFTSFAGKFATFRIQMSSAQLLALDASPVLILPRPDPDQYISLLRVDMALSAGDTQYVGGSDLMLVYGETFTNGVITWPASILTGAVDSLALGLQNGTADEPNFSAEPIFLALDGAAPTAGDGSITPYGSFVVFKA